MGNKGKKRAVSPGRTKAKPANTKRAKDETLMEIEDEAPTATLTPVAVVDIAASTQLTAGFESVQPIFEQSNTISAIPTTVPGGSNGQSVPVTPSPRRVRGDSRTDISTTSSVRSGTSVGSKRQTRRSSAQSIDSTASAAGRVKVSHTKGGTTSYLYL